MRREERYTAREGYASPSYGKEVGSGAHSSLSSCKLYFIQYVRSNRGLLCCALPDCAAQICTRLVTACIKPGHRKGLATFAIFRLRECTSYGLLSTSYTEWNTGVHTVQAPLWLIARVSISASGCVAVHPSPCITHRTFTISDSINNRVPCREAIIATLSMDGITTLGDAQLARLLEEHRCPYGNFELPAATWNKVTREERDHAAKRLQR